MTLCEAGTALKQAKLYGILDTGYSDPSQWNALAEKLIRGGVQVLQIRAKTSSASDIVSWALALRPLLDQCLVPLIINDHPELVKACHADGCHIGQDDMPVAEARQRAAVPCLVGKSSHSLAQAFAAAAEQPDYLGFGPLFATATKPTYQPIGLDLIRLVDAGLSLPYFCIGGIKKENLNEILAAGARRVVIVSGLLTAPDPETYARSLRKLLDSKAND